MALYVIADLHLSFGTDKPMDIFPGWENYTEKIAQNWRSIVKETDTVVLAGDFSWAMRLEEALADFAWLHSLPGRKLLLKGNHDYWWSTKKKIDDFLVQNGFYDIQILFNNAYEADGFVVFGTRGWLYNAKSEEDVKIVNREAGRLRLSLAAAKNLRGKPVAFLHYPPLFDNMHCAELMEILVEHAIADCYYGHIHGKLAAKKAPIGLYQGINMHLTACDYVHFTPVLVR